MKENIIKKGKLFVMTHGEYSDYELMTICKASQDIDVFALQEEYLENFKKEGWQTVPNFIKWLTVDKNVAEEFLYTEWHLGTYGNIVSSLTEP